MRTATFTKLAVLTALAAASALLGAARPAAAQGIPDTKKPTIGTVRAGLYFPFNSRAKNNVGKTWYDVGLDYTVHQTPGISRTNISLDYIERNSGGNDIRVVPLTVGQFTEHGEAGATVRPYYGFGLGVYFVHENVPNSIGVQENKNGTAFGGFLAAGLDLPSNFLIEGRYHIISNVGSVNAGGLQVMAGLRF
ncbi:MAG: hypothetical protein M3Y28_02685 [Armatimonadota bacterium]|nr:hypothetical protein [Armatimonadota bacterium]